jgi:hypothetical protein
MRYLLDADWIIQVLAGRNEAVVTHKRINLEEVAVSYVTIGEIYDVALFKSPNAGVLVYPIMIDMGNHQEEMTCNAALLTSRLDLVSL